LTFSGLEGSSPAAFDPIHPLARHR
jgi:hypothetical protein